MDFVLVHIGEKMPDYLLSNLDSLIKFGFDTHFISNEKNFVDVNPSVNTVALESFGLENIKYKTSRTGNKNHDDFLTKTSLRFFILSEYAKIEKLSEFFHIENDVFILDGLLTIQTSDFILKTKYNTSLIMDCHNRCVPSIVWFRDFNSAEHLWEHISKDTNKTDMELLADYFHLNRKVVTNFPIAPSRYFKTSTEINYSNFHKELNCIFDGAAIGQYLYGVDDGNGGKSSIGFINETSIFNPSHLSYERNKGKLLSFYQGETIPVANIHMHCKQSYKF